MTDKKDHPEIDYWAGEKKGGVELELVNLENAAFEDIKLGYFDFIRFAELDQQGDDLPSFSNGSFEVRQHHSITGQKGGVYLKPLPENILEELLDEEKVSFIAHPEFEPIEPLLAFPFTAKELNRFLAWGVGEGHDLPVRENVLLKILEARRQKLTNEANLEQTVAEPLTDQEPPVVKQGVREEPGSDNEDAGAAIDNKRTVLEQQMVWMEQWFNSQTSWTDNNLFSARKGVRGGRNACWIWLKTKELNSPGKLFGGNLKKNTSVTLAFDKAWQAFKEHKQDK